MVVGSWVDVKCLVLLAPDPAPVGGLGVKLGRRLLVPRRPCSSLGISACFLLAFGQAQPVAPGASYLWIVFYNLLFLRADRILEAAFKSRWALSRGALLAGNL